jgi:hypothetical protein
MKISIGLRLLCLLAPFAGTTAFAQSPPLPTVTLVATNGFAALGSTTATGLLTFTSSAVVTAPLTINYSLGGTAVKWNDYQNNLGSMPVAVTIPAGASSVTMPILGIANSTNANPETAIFTLAAGTGYTIGAANTATITISALPIVTVVATSPTATIGSTTATGLLTFTRTGATTAALTVNYALGGTAVKWNDYQNNAGSMPVTVTFPAGSAVATLVIDGIANTTNASPETAIFTLSAGAGYVVGTASTATITLIPAAVAVLPTVTIAATTATATIGSSTATGLLTFTRTGATTAALVVNYSLSGTAVKWNDYQNNAGSMPVTVTIPAASASTTMTIVAIANTTNASPETAIFTLSASPTYTVGAANAATITISPAVTVAPPVTTSPVTTTAINEMDDIGLMQPMVGDNALRVLTPTWLELRQINTQPSNPTQTSAYNQVTSWNLVDANANFIAPALSQFAVTVNGQPVSVVAVGFRRRPLAASMIQYDLKIDNALYLQLATPVPDGATVVVTNPSGALWPATTIFSLTANPLRYSPAIHVNQEGYVPTLPKKAMVGYYMGNLGELPVSGLTTFSLINAASGATVYSGALTPRPDLGYASYTGTLPYQQVLQADFSSFTTPGEYYLQVPGLGTSLPFLLDDGIAMAWMRTYAAGMYFQRSGMAVGLPYTRFAHDADHTAPASVPVPDSAYAFTWTTIASKNGGANVNPLQTAPQLTSTATSLYPFVNTGTVNVSGGHFDAGDYSKYTIDCAALVHYLMFTVDSIPGAASLDNLGIPESGDGIPDLLQEAKWEADYIAKLQDADGGFYFIVYPQNREYENTVSLTGGHDGDAQVVWPKNTSCTAAAVAALAECASSPAFKKAYPATAALYLQKATLGWQFLMNAIAKYGLIGSYQKITFYGDEFAGLDQEAWAACEMYLATGNPIYQQQLLAWFPNPSNSATWEWGWVHLTGGYGNAIRSYAFAAISGRLQPSQLTPAYLALCDAEIATAGDNALLWSNQTAYATSFPSETKLYNSAGWYFSLNAASDMAVAYQLNPKAAYIDAIVGNMNYEGGTNPVNLTYLTGLGLKRQHVTVSQYALNNNRVFTPDGIPIGNIQAGFDYLPLYGSQLASLTFPADAATPAPYPFYDRAADTWAVTTELVTVNQARSVLALSVLVNQTASASTPWTYGTAQITAPSSAVPLGAPTSLTVQTPGMDMTNARVVWEARDQQPALGATFTPTPTNNGPQWVEAEVEWPDGRRAFATSTYTANNPTVNWVDGSIPSGDWIDGEPTGFTTGADGGDAWTWVTSNPAPYSAPADHQSNVAAGLHDHWFTNTTSTLAINTGDSLFAYVYLDPVNTPTEIELMWTDSTGNAAHRAYWGAYQIAWGTKGTASEFNAGPLPAAGQWVRLTVPASAVGLEGQSLQGMRFALYGGRATWDVSGKSSTP